MIQIGVPCKKHCTKFGKYVINSNLNIGYTLRYSMTKIDMCDPCLAQEEPELNIAVSHGRTVARGNPIKFCRKHQSVWKSVNQDSTKVFELLGKANGGANKLLRSAQCNVSLSFRMTHNLFVNTQAEGTSAANTCFATKGTTRHFSECCRKRRYNEAR